MRSDRNLYSKSLIESQDEIAEMKRKFKIMNHQIEQLKEEIQAKDQVSERQHSYSQAATPQPLTLTLPHPSPSLQAYVKERIEHTRSDKEKEALKNELMRLKKVVTTAETTLKNYQSEVDKLNHIISEADAERFRQQREYDVVINERDILGTQLIRRNDELALLYEKIKIQRAAISQGEIAYRERLEDLRVLRLRENGIRRSCIYRSRSPPPWTACVPRSTHYSASCYRTARRLRRSLRSSRTPITRTGGASWRARIRGRMRWYRRSRRCRSV